MLSLLSKLNTASHSTAAVDCHFHIFRAHQAVRGARYKPSYAAELGDWSSRALPLGVQRGLLVQPSFLGTDNSLMLQALAQSGGALRGVVVLDPATPTPGGVLRQMHVLGVRGIRLNLSGVNHDVQAWVQANGLWADLNALGWHLELHTDPGALPGVLAQLLPSLPPRLCVVMDHFAKPAAVSAQDATVLALRKMAAAGRPVVVKLSGAYRIGVLDPAALACLWLAELGPHSLVWGSDWPCTNFEPLADYAKLHNSLDEWLDDPEIVRQVRVDNPNRLLWGDEPAV